MLYNVIYSLQKLWLKTWLFVLKIYIRIGGISCLNSNVDTWKKMNKESQSLKLIHTERKPDLLDTQTA